MRKRIWKTVLENSSLKGARIISKMKAAVHENTFSNPFSGFPSRAIKPNPWNPYLDFLIEIHPEDGFQISRSIAKSEIRISQSKATLVMSLR